ncbi:MAG TPA: tetratricopeptide repeat protein [Methanothrix sp.]|nr:tetratricopeptide repeat protein [Methanothrix sp.]
MDQLVVLQMIYEAFFKGVDGLQKINSKSIEGCCPELVAGLLDGMKKGRIDEEICRQLSNKLENIYEIKRAGDIILQAGYFRLAVETYSRALSLCSDPVMLPVLQNNLGRAYAASGDLGKAVYYYEKAADCFSREDDKAGLAHVLGNLGSAFRRHGDYDRAVEYCYKSLKTFEDISDAEGVAQMTGSLGRIYADMGERDLAARYFEKSLNDFEALGDQKSAAWILDRMGRLAAAAGEWDTAICRYHQSLSIFEHLGRSTSQGIVLSNLGRAFLELHEPDAAREPLERAVRLLPRHARPGYQNALSALAAAYCSLGEKSLKRAEDIERAALKMAELTHQDETELSGYEEEISSAEKARRKASRLFTLAADRYQELSASLPGSAEGRSQVKAEALLAKSRSYLALLGASTSDEKASSLAERALSALEGAAAHSSAEGRERILALQRAVSGMKEAYSSSLLKSDPDRAAGSISRAADHLLESLGGEEGPVTGGGGSVRGGILQSLKSIGAAAQCCKAKNRGAGWQQAVAQELLSAAEGLGTVSGAGVPARISSDLSMAARALQNAAGEKGDQMQEDVVQHDFSGVLDPARDALILLGGTVVRHFLGGIRGLEALPVWDESMRLLTSSGRPNLAVLEGRSKEEESHEVSERGEVRVKKLILADGTVEEPEAFPSENADPEEGWLVPMRLEVAGRDGDGALLRDEDRLLQETGCSEYEGEAVAEGDERARAQSGGPQEHVSPGDEGGDKPEGRDLPAGDDWQSGESMPDSLISANEGSSLQAEDGTELEEPAAGGDEFWLHSEGGLDRTESASSDLETEREPQFGPFNLSQGIAALKGLTIIVVMLLAVEAVLHLI